MAKPAQKNSTPTQKFIEITDIIDDIVILANGNACLIIEVMATNFSLLSAEEQGAEINSYASLLNALSFSIQIVILTKRLDISAYVKLLDEETNKAQDQTLAKQIGLYRNFIQELVKVNTILDKKFLIVIPYSSLEKGISGATQTIGDNNSKNDFLAGAKAALYSKADSVHSQLRRLNLKSETLSKEKLTKLFYNIFNDSSIEHQTTEHFSQPMTTGKEMHK
jgi:hypothetical protein